MREPTTVPNSSFRTLLQNGGDRQRNADEYPFMATEQKAKGVLTLIKFYEKRVQNEKGTSRRLNKAVMYSNSFQCLQNWKELTTMFPTL